MSRIEGNLHVNGQLSAVTMPLATGAVSRNDQVATTGDPIDATKLEHRHTITVPLSDHATDSAVVRKVAHVVQGATADIVSFEAGVTVAATSTGVCAVDLKVNGSTVLTGTITLDSGNAAFSQEAAPGFTDTTLVAGDVVEISIESTSGSNKPKGVHATVVIDEKP